MNEFSEQAPDSKHPTDGASTRMDGDVVERIGAKEERRLRARREKGRSVWFGLGMFGMVGWSVAVPAVIGTVAGAWIDRHTEGAISWTLTGLILGTVSGILIAWNWIAKESKVE